MNKKLFLAIFSLIATIIKAQTGDLELSSTSYSTITNGPLYNTGAFTFLQNTDNPTGNTFATYTPTTTVTFGLSNPQYTGTGTFNVGGVSNPAAFGYGGPNTSTGGAAAATVSSAFYNNASSKQQYLLYFKWRNGRHWNKLSK